MEKLKLRIAVILSEDYGYTRSVRRGIFRHAHAMGSVECHTFRQDENLASTLKTWGADGIIIGHWPVCSDVLALGVPLVSCSGRSDFSIPTVCVDEDAAARLAVDHFIERGFRRIGYVGMEGHLLSQRRRDALHRELNRRGREFDWFEFAIPHQGQLIDIYQTDLGLEEWIESLPSQTVLRTYNDVLGYQVIDACTHAGVHVPDDIAVLGMDDDEDINLLPYPPLSSIRVPAEQVGFEAFSLLKDLIEGKPAPSDPVRIAATSVITRASSETFAIENPKIREAIEFIHKNACTGIGVKDVLKNQTVSRPTFIKHFKAAVGRGPLSEIRRIRMDKAKQLLADTDQTTSEIAVHCGYGNETRFYSTFQQFTDMTPGAYRKRFRMR